MTTIDEIKARLDIVDLASESVQLRRSGKNYSGFCPFHSNTRTPAFVVFPETGTWRCFGECNDGGDIFKFMMKKEGYDFSEALRELAERTGVELHAPTSEEQVKAEEYDRLRQILEEALIFYQHNLRNTPAGQKALEYLHGRGLNDEIIETFGLGYAPHSWDAAHKHFLQKGYTEQELIGSGLVSERDSGGIYDRFRHRITFPIRDARGQMTGFGARILNPEDLPKFLNSPQTALFDKSNLLYGLDQARREIRAQDQVVIVEGYLDVIGLHQHGFRNAVSPMGTALTEQQLRMIKRYTRRIVLAMDPDAAGIKATLRGLEIARQTMDREGELRFDARGLLQQEARLQADIRVTTLPDGMDPDDVVNRDPEEWVRILDAAQPIVIHVMETLAIGRNLDDPKIKRELAEQVLPLIEDVPNAIERDTYRQRLARLLKVDERSLVGTTPVTRTRPQRFRPQTAGRPEQSQLEARRGTAGIQNREAHILGMLLRHPELIYHIDRNLQSQGLERINAIDFQLTDHQMIFQLIQKSLLQEDREPLDHVLNHLPESMMEAAESVLTATVNLDPLGKDILEDLLRTLLMLRARDVSQRLDHLRFEQENQQELGDPKASESQIPMAQYIVLLGRLHKAQNFLTHRTSNLK